MKNCIFIFTIFLFGFQIRNDYGQNLYVTRETRYILRILNTTNLDWTGQPFIKDVKLTVRNMQHYYSANVTIKRDFMLRRIFTTFERCRDLEIACENFQTWSVSEEICRFSRLKNQFWSQWIEASDLMNFPKTCPLIEKGIHELKSFTFDVNWILTFYRDAPKYYWKMQTFFYNERNEIEYQTYGLGRFIFYTKRERTPLQRKRP